MRGVLIAAVLVLGGCGSKEEPVTPVVSAASQTAIQAAVVEIAPAQVPVRVEVTGQVTPIYQAVLSSRIQGTMSSISVRPVLEKPDSAAAVL